MAMKRIPYQKCSLVWRESKILPNPVFCSYKRKRKKQLWSGLRQKLIRTYLLSDDRYRKCQLKCTCFGNMIRMMSQIWQSLCWTTVQSKYVRNINKKRKMPSSSIQPFLCTQTCIVGGIWIRSWRTPLKMTFDGSFSLLALTAWRSIYCLTQEDNFELKFSLFTFIYAAVPPVVSRNWSPQFIPLSWFPNIKLADVCCLEMLNSTVLCALLNSDCVDLSQWVLLFWMM